MSKILDYFQEKLIADQSIANGDELDFFFNEFKPKNPEDRKLVAGVRQRLDYFSYAGLALGLSLAFSLKRYSAPSQGFPFVKLLAGITLPVAGFGFCLKKGTANAIAELQSLRKKLLEEDDDQYFEHLQVKFRKFPRIYQRDYDIVDEILSEEEFVELKNKSRKNFANLTLQQITGKMYSQ